LTLKNILYNININLFTNVLNQLLGIGFPILVQFYTIRHFNITDIGYLSLLNSYWSIFALSLSFFNYYLLKLFASSKDEKFIKTYLSNSTFLMYAIILIPFSFFIVFLHNKYPHLLNLTILTSLPIITAPLSFEIYFQASLRNKFILKRRFITRLFFFLFMFIFANNKDDFIIYVYLFCLAPTFENIINFFYLKNNLSFKYIKLSVLKIILKQSISYLPFNLTYNLIPNLSTIAASHFVSIDQLTIFSILVRIVNLSTSFITSTVMVLYPVKVQLSSENSSIKFDDTRFMKNTFVISLLVSIFLIIIHKVIFKAFLKDYYVEGMLFHFSILTIFIIIHSLYNYVTFNYYFINERISFITKMNILIILIYFVNIILVYLGLISFNFSILFIFPYPFVMLLIYLDIYKFRKSNL
jgi:O-antigen/teichoic acid export membrane protein